MKSTEKIKYPPVYIGFYVLLVTSILSVVSRDEDVISGLLILLSLATVYGIGLIINWYYGEKNAATLKMITNVLLVISLLVFLSAYAASGLEKAFLLFLMCIQAARNFTLATRRDLYFALIISLILILYASSKSYETSFIGYIVVFVLAGIFTLMAHHMDEKMNLAKGGDKDVLMRKMNIPVKGLGIFAVTMALSVVIYMFLPRLPSPHIQSFPASGGNLYADRDFGRGIISIRRHKDVRDPKIKNSGEAVLRGEYGGFEEKFDITNIGDGFILNDVVFYLHSGRPVYSRGKVFDTFDGSIWENIHSGERALFSDDGKFVFNENYQGEGVEQTYTIKKRLHGIIFTAYRPAVLHFPSDFVMKNDEFSLGINEPLEKETVYSSVSEIVEIDGRPSGGREPLADKDRYLQVPGLLSERVKDLGQSLTNSIHDDYSKAIFIEQHLKRNYQYTLNTLFMKWKDDSLDKFLFEVKKGHCELFATSMAIMLRTIGIPSRLATGFVAKRYNPLTGYYEVKKLDAHAWVEAYFPEYGWVSFEPTPSYQFPESVRRYFVLTTLSKYFEDQMGNMIRTNPDTWRGKIMNAIYKLYTLIKSILNELWLWIKKLMIFLWKWFKEVGILLITAIIVISAVGYWLYRFLKPVYHKWDFLNRLKKLRRLKDSDPRKFIIRCYLEMENAFTKKGLSRPLYFTPTEYRGILIGRFHNLSSQVDTITELFQKTRYSRYNAGSDDAETAYRACEDIWKFCFSMK
jgi:transglutaminase-like putative cysteine protease